MIGLAMIRSLLRRNGYLWIRFDALGSHRDG